MRRLAALTVCGLLAVTLTGCVGSTLDLDAIREHLAKWLLQVEGQVPSDVERLERRAEKIDEKLDRARTADYRKCVRKGTKKGMTSAALALVESQCLLQHPPTAVVETLDECIARLAGPDPSEIDWMDARSRCLLNRPLDL